MSKEKVKCEVCGREMKQITYLHLRLHNMTVDDYRRKFPDSPLLSNSTKKKLKYRFWRDDLPDEDKLYELYVKKNMTSPEIAKIYNCDPWTIIDRARKYGIEIRKGSRKKHISPETEFKKGHKVPEEWKEKYSKANKGRTSHRKGMTLEEEYGKEKAEKIREKMSKRKKMLWGNPEKAREYMENLHGKPNNLEQKIIDIIEEYNLPLKYTGGGKKVIDGKIPDFSSTNGVKVVLEVFGRPFHDPNNTFIDKMPYRQTEEGTREHYERNDYRCLIMWNEEINNSTDEELAQRIQDFTEKTN